MTTHRPILTTGETYHIYNRSIGKEPVFASLKSLNKILEIIEFYRFNQQIRLSKFQKLPQTAKRAYLLTPQILLVEIYADSFMPNHFHLQLKQLIDGGIRQFISNMQNSFAKYYNLKHERDGGLFQTFKAKRVETDEQFMHLSRYIHINHITSNILTLNELLISPRTSLPGYMGVGGLKQNFVEYSRLLSYFKSPKHYLKFLANQVDYQKKLHKIKKLL